MCCLHTALGAREGLGEGGDREEESCGYGSTIATDCVVSLDNPKADLPTPCCG